VIATRLKRIGRTVRVHPKATYCEVGVVFSSMYPAPVIELTVWNDGRYELVEREYGSSHAKASLAKGTVVLNKED